MKTLIALATLLAAPLAHADTQYKTEYQCFNRAQLTDAPAVSIVSDSESQVLVDVEGRGIHKFIPVKLASLGTGVIRYTGEGVTVTIAENGSRGATVQLASINLPYTCQAAAAQ